MEFSFNSVLLTCVFLLLITSVRPWMDKQLQPAADNSLLCDPYSLSLEPKEKEIRLFDWKCIATWWHIVNLFLISWCVSCQTLPCQAEQLRCSVPPTRTTPDGVLSLRLLYVGSSAASGLQSRYDKRQPLAGESCSMTESNELILNLEVVIA